MSTEVLICAVCASSDFLVENMSFFHFGMGLLLGSTLSLRCFEKWSLTQLVSTALSQRARRTSTGQDLQGGLDLH
jgi:hypothetical protein